MAMRRPDRPNDMTTSWQRDVDRMFRTLSESLGGLRGLPERDTAWLPATDILTRGDDLVIRLEIPGIDPEKDVEITVEDGMLRVRGERQETQEEEGEGYIRRETVYGAFERVIGLPPGARMEDLKASYDDGILEIVVPGAARRSSQRVPVSASGQKRGRSSRRRSSEAENEAQGQAQGEGGSTGESA